MKQHTVSQFVSWYNISNKMVFFLVIFLSLLQGLPQADTRNQLSATLVMSSCILLTILSTNTAQLTVWMKKLAAKGMLLFHSWQLSVIYWTWVVHYWTLCVTNRLTWLADSLTNFMEQSPSREPNSCSAIQEVLQILWD